MKKYAVASKYTYRHTCCTKYSIDAFLHVYSKYAIYINKCRIIIKRYESILLNSNKYIITKFSKRPCNPLW